MKTQWVNDVSGEYFDDYDEARESVMKYMVYTDNISETLVVYIDLYGIDKVLKGLTDPAIGQQIHEEVIEMAEERFLSDWLVEVETEDDEDEEE